MTSTNMFFITLILYYIIKIDLKLNNVNTLLAIPIITIIFIVITILGNFFGSN